MSYEKLSRQEKQSSRERPCQQEEQSSRERPCQQEEQSSRERLCQQEEQSSYEKSCWQEERNSYVERQEKQNSCEAHKYDDMLRLPHHVSANHPQMPLLDRAAQFAPFAALTGYDAVVREAASYPVGKAAPSADISVVSEAADCRKQK